MGTTHQGRKNELELIMASRILVPIMTPGAPLFIRVEQTNADENGNYIRHASVYMVVEGQIKNLNREIAIMVPGVEYDVRSGCVLCGPPSELFYAICGAMGVILTYKEL